MRQTRSSAKNNPDIKQQIDDDYKLAVKLSSTRNINKSKASFLANSELRDKNITPIPVENPFEPLPAKTLESLIFNKNEPTVATTVALPQPSTSTSKLPNVTQYTGAIRKVPPIVKKRTTETRREIRSLDRGSQYSNVPERNPKISFLLDSLNLLSHARPTFYFDKWLAPKYTLRKPLEDSHSESEKRLKLPSIREENQQKILELTRTETSVSYTITASLPRNLSENELNASIENNTTEEFFSFGGALSSTLNRDFQNLQIQEIEDYPEKSINVLVPIANNANMAETPQSISIKDAIKVVPEFDGEVLPLTPFLDGCDEALGIVGRTNERNLVKLLRAKLTGEARKSLIGQNFDSLEEFKAFLKKLYFAPTSLHQLRAQAGQLYQFENESVVSYANRMREIGRKIIETYTHNENPSAQQLDSFKESTDALLMECFRRGLDLSIEQRLGEQNSLQELFTQAVKIEKQLADIEQLRSGNYNLAGQPRKSNIASCLAADIKTQFADVIKCQLCNGTHSAKDCPKVKGKGQKDGREACQICHKRNHLAPQCFKIFPPKRENWVGRKNDTKNPRNNITCRYCKKPGHELENCETLKKRNANRTPSKQGNSRGPTATSGQRDPKSSRSE